MQGLQYEFPVIDGVSERQISYAEHLREKYVNSHIDIFRDIDEDMTNEIDYMALHNGERPEYEDRYFTGDRYTKRVRICLFCTVAGAIIENLRYPCLLENDDVDYLKENLNGIKGIYAFIDGKGNVVYIGKSKNLSDRIPTSYNERYRQADISKILYYPTEFMGDANILEVLLIAKYQPRLNKDCNDGYSKMAKTDIDIINDFTELPFDLGD